MNRVDFEDILLTEIRSIVHSAKDQLPGFREDRFLRAYTFAKDAHEGQFRKDGVTPYIVHPVETAKILSSFTSDEDTLISALLHDVPEDTSRSVEEIEDTFGTPVAFLVDGITKLSKVHYQNNMEQRQIESLKKMLIHTARDPRVILIKLADRLHNMRTLQFVDKPEKRKRIARETLEIYVPMANLLGIQGIKSEMEDLCFKHLYAEEYEQFHESVRSSEKQTRPILEKTLLLLEEEFQKHHIEASFLHRKKTLYSIFQKLQSEKKDVSDVYDIITLRVLVDDIDDCYKALGIIHTLFKPKTGRFKDYIALPKANEYRSLHTTVFGLNGVLTEFQIRTQDMHRQAEIGIASLMKDHDKNDSEWKQRQFWVDDFLAVQGQEKNDQEFLEDLKGDTLEDRISTFTPTGDSIYLPKGSTGVDFAYAVKTDVGNHAVRLDVNGEEKKLISVLKNGDTVAVLTSEHAHPQYEWLSFCKTHLAKTQIREFFKKESRKTKINKGRSILQKFFDRAGLGLVDEISFSELQESLSKIIHVNFKNLDELFIAITEGSVDPLEVIGALFPDRHLKHIRRSGFFSSLFSRINFFRKKNTQLVELRICGIDRAGLLKDIVDVLSQFSLNISKVKGWNKTHGKGKGMVLVALELETFDLLNAICSHLEQIDGVEKVERVFFGKHLSFFLALFVALGFWISHPLLLQMLIDSGVIQNSFAVGSFLFAGLFMILYLSLYLHVATRRCFSAFRETNEMFFSILFLSLFALATILAELFYYHAYFYDWLSVVLGLTFVSLYIVFQIFQFWKIKKRLKMKI